MSELGNVPSLPLHEFSQVNGPIIDIRSPMEYSKGHWPGSKNIPLFNDKEREVIGTVYKKKGQQQAIIEGMKFIIPKLSELKSNLNSIYYEDKKKNNLTNKYYLRIYCWRGGMRSKSLVWLLNQFEINAIQLKGGYKSYRNNILKLFEEKWRLSLIGGKTGTGKTKLLLALEKHNIFYIDLEGLANHRGSSFGNLGLPIQPTCEQYENLLGEALKKCKTNTQKTIWLEDESPNLGKCRIPNSLIKQMRNAPVLQIVRIKEERIKELVDGYSKYPKDEIKEAIIRIKNRLGPQRTKVALEAINLRKWEIACSAILDYYDRCYEHQLSKVENLTTIDISSMEHNEAAKLLIKKGLVY